VAANKHSSYSQYYPDSLVYASEKLALAMWDAIPPERWSDYDPPTRFLAKYEARAFPAFLRYIAVNAGRRLELAIPFRSPLLAPVVADALARLKTARPTARRWLLLHAETAAIALIPQAVGPRGAAREAAANALRFLAANGHEESVMSTAGRYGAVAAAAVREALDFDPLLLFPSKLPKLPPFWQQRAFTRPLLRSNGAALPASAMDALATMLAFSSLGEPYAGIAEVKEACEPSSLGGFAWDVFSAWLAAGAPSKEAWALYALGHLGDDSCARRLAPLIREWPGQAAHARAVTGLDVLAAIGSDVALMHLNSIAQKVKFKGLQPWRQLGREVYRPGEDERAAKKLTRWMGVTLPTGKVLELEQRGWRRGAAQDGGVSPWYLKPLPSGHEVQLSLDPGIIAGAALEWNEQTLGEVTIERDGGWGGEGVMAFGELDPILFSELVRDLEALRN
jgi:hypothetical protein